MRFGDLDFDTDLHEDFDLLRRTGDLEMERLERNADEDLLCFLGFLDLDLDLLLFLNRDLDLLRITLDLDRVRLTLLIDLDLDRRMRDIGVLFLEREIERLPRRADLERVLERFFLRDADLLDLDRDRRGFITDLDLVLRPRLTDLLLDLLFLVRDLDLDRRLRFPERDLDLRRCFFVDLDRDRRLADGDLENRFCVLLLRLELDLSLDTDLFFCAEDLDDCFGVLDRLRLDFFLLSSERESDLNLDSASLSASSLTL